MAGGKRSPSPVTWGQHLREKSEHFCRTSKVSISLIRWAFVCQLYTTEDTR